MPLGAYTLGGINASLVFSYTDSFFYNGGASQSAVDADTNWTKDATGTRFHYDTNGDIVEIGNDEMGEYFDPTTGNTRGLAIFEGRTNYTEVVTDWNASGYWGDNSGWIGHATDMADDVAASPYGASTAVRVTEDSQNRRHIVEEPQHTGLSTTLEYSYTGLMKDEDNADVDGRVITFLGGGAVTWETKNSFAVAGVNNRGGFGTITTPQRYAQSVANGDGFYETVLFGVIGQTSQYSGIAMSDRDDPYSGTLTNGWPSYSGDGTSSFLAVGYAMQTLGPAPRIKTDNTGTESRTDDILSIAAARFGSPTGTFCGYIKFYLEPTLETSDRVLLEFYENPTNYVRLFVDNSDEVQLDVVDGGSTTISATDTTNTVSQRASHTIAFRVKANDSGISVNGNTIQKDTNGTIINGIATLYVGATQAAGSYLDGYIEELAIYDGDISDADLEALNFGVVDLSAQDIESASEIDSPTAALSSVDLTPQDLVSLSEVDGPTIGQAHILASQNLESASELDGSTIGQTHAITGQDVESASEVDGPTPGQTQDLTAQALVSMSEIAAATLAQTHIFTGQDLISLSQIDSPTIAQDHTLTGQDVESASEIDSPTAAQANVLTGQDLESASEIDGPTIDQDHTLTGQDVESASEIDGPTIDQDHTLTGQDVESASEIDSPSMSGEESLVAQDIESASEVDGPTIGQDHTLSGQDLESASEVSNSTIGQDHSLTGQDVESASEIDGPIVGQEHDLTGQYLESASEIESPSPSGEIELTGQDLESASEIDGPTIGQEHALTGQDLESASELDAPSMEGVEGLVAANFESVSEIGQPALTHVVALTGQDLESASELDAPSIGQVHIFVAADLESASQVDNPTFSLLINLTAQDLESVSELDAPTLTNFLTSITYMALIGDPVRFALTGDASQYTLIGDPTNEAEETDGC